jgi:imidazolonepropionase-like amidohydrolase
MTTRHRSPASSARAANALLAALFCAATPGARAQAPAPPLYVRAGQLIDPASETVIADAAIVLDGDCIVAVGPASAVDVPRGATLVDWTRFSVLPGLVDAHTHVCFATDEAAGTCPWERTAELSPDQLLVLARENARAMLHAGITTAIDKGGAWGVDLELRDEIAAGATPGPRLITAGDGLLRPPPEVEDPYPGIVRTAAEIVPEIRRQARAGSGLIKLWADACSDRRLACEPLFRPEELAVAVAEAHRVGLTIAIHAYLAASALPAIAARPDALEHAVELDATTLAEMARNGTVFVPTIEHNRYYAENAAWFGYTSEDASALQEFADRAVATARLAHRAGVRMALGSDAVFTMFGQNAREIRGFVAAGLDPLAALRAATVNGLVSVRRAGELGRIAPGYLADLVAVDGDPLADPAVVAGGVRGVIRGGRPVAVDASAPPAR